MRILLALFLCILLVDPLPANRLTVVIDPGHGGRGTSASAQDGDHWNPRRHKFEYPFNHGATHGSLEEHVLVLDICRRARDILRTGSTKSGFPEFRDLLARYGKSPHGVYVRPDLQVILTREDNYESPDKAGLHNVNRFYRLYDSPLSFLPDGKPHSRLYPGRLSWINMLQPELVVAVHINASSDHTERGQAAVITPHGDWFKLVDDLRKGTGKDATEDITRLLTWYGVGVPVVSRIASMPRDVDTYFDRLSDWPRHQRLTWAYNRSESAWRRRENGQMERQRRGGGRNPGGDNLRASEDILRWIRRSLLQAQKPDILKQAGEANRIIGPLGPPFARDYAVPMFVNGVCAYLEIAHLTNREDRRLLERHLQSYAEGIAVGIYAQIYGLIPRSSMDDEQGGAGPPHSTPIDFKAYKRGGQDYFRQVSAPGRPFPPWVLTWKEKEPPFQPAKVKKTASKSVEKKKRSRVKRRRRR